MPRIYLLLFVFIIGFSITEIKSQPAATVSVLGGYSIPLGVLYQKFGNTSDSLAPESDQYYYLTYGYSYGVTFKKGLGKKRNIRITGSLNFTIMGQSKDYNYPDYVSVKLRQSFLSLGLGADWNLAPKNGLVNPYAGAELNINLFGGSLQQAYTSITNTLNLTSAIRYGVNFGGGVDFQFHQNVGAQVGIKYYMANLFGKKTNGATGTNYGLDDGAHSYAGVLYPARSINVLQLYGGFSYYFGR